MIQGRVSEHRCSTACHSTQVAMIIKHVIQKAVVRRVLHQQASHPAAGRQLLAGSYRRSTCGHSFRSPPTGHTGLPFLVEASVADLAAVDPAGAAGNPYSVADRTMDTAVAAAGAVSMGLGSCYCRGD